MLWITFHKLILRKIIFVYVISLVLLVVLNPPQQTAEKWALLQKDAFSCRRNS